MKRTHRKVTISSSAATTDERPEQALKAQIQQATEALAAEMQAGVSDRYQRLLDFASRFYQYSTGNQLLIMLQMPEASHVAGYRTWEQMGYHVAKGQKGIRILAPRTYRKRGKATDDTDSDEQRMGLYFSSVAVFDASQLNPDEVTERPLPTFYHPLGSDEETEALCVKTIQQLATAGIRVEERDDLGGEKQGYSAPGGYIALRRGLPSRNRIRTLVHEWAHELLHQQTGLVTVLSKSVKECQAEATAYVVLAHFGIHNEFSSDYLQNWGNTPEALMAELSAVQKAAAQIIQALEAKSSTSEAE